MADVTRLLAERDFASLDEANAFLQQALLGGKAAHSRPRSAVAAAQEVMDDAWEAGGMLSGSVTDRRIRVVFPPGLDGGAVDDEVPRT